jgi:hypothetical protein
MIMATKFWPSCCVQVTVEEIIERRPKRRAGRLICCNGISRGHDWPQRNRNRGAGGRFQKLLSALVRRAAAAEKRYLPANRGAPFRAAGG